MRPGCALLFLLTAACGDGVGVPIRRAVAASESDAGTRGHAGSGEPAQARCEEVADWSRDAEEAEFTLILMINAVRTQGVRCGERDLGPMQQLRPAPELQCSARLHSVDMATHHFVGNNSSDGVDPGTRMEAAGFELDSSGESIAQGESEPERVLQELLGDWDDCTHVGDWHFTAIGVGRYETLWTIDFAEADIDGFTDREPRRSPPGTF